MIIATRSLESIWKEKKSPEDWGGQNPILCNPNEGGQPCCRSRTNTELPVNDQIMTRTELDEKAEGGTKRGLGPRMFVARLSKIEDRFPLEGPGNGLAWGKTH